MGALAKHRIREGQGDGSMSARHSKGRLAPFVPLLKDTLSSPAWRATSHGARSLYVALKLRYSSNFNNNGRIFLSQRDAAVELNSHHTQIARWFRELRHYGFIVMTDAGCLGVDGKGKAPHWRLTELGYMHEMPTKDFMRWNGQSFSSKYLEPRAGNPARGAPEIQHSSVLEIQHTQAPNRAGNPAHRDSPTVPEIQHITRFTTPTLAESAQSGDADDLGIPAFLRRVDCAGNG
jgi:hypothetical protein